MERSENLHHEDDECETLEILEQHFGGFGVFWWFLVVFGGFNFNIYELVGESNFVLCDSFFGVPDSFWGSPNHFGVADSFWGRRLILGGRRLIFGVADSFCLIWFVFF